MVEEEEKEEMAEETIETTEEADITPAEESFEQKQNRLWFEEYRRRNEASLVERKAILERNNLKFEDHTQADGVEIVRQCCGK